MPTAIEVKVFDTEKDVAPDVEESVDLDRLPVMNAHVNAFDP